MKIPSAPRSQRDCAQGGTPEFTSGVPDDDLRRRLQELGRREAGSAPPLGRVIQGRPASQGPSGLAHALRGAVALATVLLLAVTLAWWRPARPVREEPLVLATAIPLDPVAEWNLPSDALLMEVGDMAADREVERLSQEIEGLLQP